MDQGGGSYDVVLPPFQSIRRLAFLDTNCFSYVPRHVVYQVHSKGYVSKKVKMSYNWNGESISMRTSNILSHKCYHALLNHVKDPNMLK